MWEKRKDGKRPLDSFVGLHTVKHADPEILLDYFEFAGMMYGKHIERYPKYDP